MLVDVLVIEMFYYDVCVFGIRVMHGLIWLFGHCDMQSRQHVASGLILF
jgi:hypothetical protein